MAVGATETCHDGVVVSKPDCSWGSSCWIRIRSLRSGSSAGGLGGVEHQCRGVSGVSEMSWRSWVGLQSLPADCRIRDVGLSSHLLGLSLPEVVMYEEVLTGLSWKVYGI